MSHIDTTDVNTKPKEAYELKIVFDENFKEYFYIESIDDNIIEIDGRLVLETMFNDVVNIDMSKVLYSSLCKTPKLVSYEIV